MMLHKRGHFHRVLSCRCLQTKEGYSMTAYGAPDCSTFQGREVCSPLHDVMNSGGKHRCNRDRLPMAPPRNAPLVRQNEHRPRLPRNRVWGRSGNHDWSYSVRHSRTRLDIHDPSLAASHWHRAPRRPASTHAVKDQGNTKKTTDDTRTERVLA